MLCLVASLLLAAEPAASAPAVVVPAESAPAVTIPAEANAPAVTIPAASAPGATIPALSAPQPPATAASPAAPEPTAAAAQPAAPPAQPAAVVPAAQPAPSPAPGDPDAPFRVTASLGLERAWPGGSLYEGIPMNDLTSSLFGFRLDFGVRITRRWMAAIVLDMMGGGTPGLTDRLRCGLNDAECSISSTRTSLEGRYVFAPTAPRTWWAGAGLGSETTRVVLKDSKELPAYLPAYHGSVFPRLSGGWDRRMNRTWGWGFYGALSFGQFTKQSMGDSTEKTDLPAKARGHSWLDLGVRIILFP